MISVIVPVYNAEKWLRRCINSILTQTYPDIELVLVNDGSTDRSLEICREYEKRDGRVLVIDQKNSGPSMARNNGIRRCNGEYLCFVDADDWLEPDACEQLVQAIKQTNADMIVYGYRRVFNGLAKVEDVNVDTGLYDKEDALKELALNYIFSPVSKKVKVFGCLRLIRKRIMFENNLWFNPEVHRGEDFLLFAQLHLHVRSVYSMTDKVLYNYNNVKTSITNTYVEDMWEMALKTYHILRDAVRNKEEEYKERVNCILIYRSRLCFENIMKANHNTSFKLRRIQEIVNNPDLQMALNITKGSPLIKEMKIYCRILESRNSLLNYLYALRMHFKVSVRRMFLIKWRKQI